MSELSILHWTAAGQPQQAVWRSESGAAAPKRVELVDDQTPADRAYRLACEGVGLLWRGDFHNGKQLLQALGRRLDKRETRREQVPSATGAQDLTAIYHAHRKRQAERASILNRLMIELDAQHRIALRRAPDVRMAAQEAYGDVADSYVIALRELQGVVGAHEWRKKGVDVAALGARIHPHYGVFSPLRGEYLDLVAQARLPAALQVCPRAFDIGTGSGVLALVLAKRGVTQVVGTDMAPRALACAQDNVARCGLTGQIEVRQTDLFPEGQAALIVCNPPWLPGRPSSSVEQAVYDPNSQMLRGFLQGLAAHLAPGGEGWLIMSDLAERLGLRTRDTLLSWIDAAGLQVIARHDTRPVHAKSRDVEDPLHAARSQEVTSLWRLAARA